MRLLHPCHDSLGQSVPGRAPDTDRGPGEGGARGESLPLHGLSEDRGRGPCGRARARGQEMTMRVVGKSLARVDAPGKVSGTAVYAADFALPGMLCGRVLRSTLPHARILRLDVTRACALPGVRAVITAADVPDVRYGGAVKDETAFAKDRVRYVGQPVAAVAAATPEVAETALAAIDVVYEPMPTVLDLEAALAPGAPLVHEGYTEPRAAVAAWDSSGQVTVWSNTQLPFEVQNTLAEVLQILPSKIRVVVPGIGGGFGGKLRIGVEH